ncbi:hypothetical protein [Haloarchaeobius litoreus]|uniref:Uncharacterized protein n=1 Tax=Haloarchaeobius litoreus TaxID=755306 RepID=A0ABD6DP12_9EURY|nr:hypothetical protein [Haloarchaeobius litoreus]
MSRPPLDPRTRQFADRPTWRRIAASYLLLTAIPVALLAVSNPFVAAAMLVGVAALVTAGRHTYRLAQCIQNCRRLTFDLFGSAEITVRQLPADDVCC